MTWFPINKYNDHILYIGGTGFPSHEEAKNHGVELECKIGEERDTNIGALEIADSVAPYITGKFLNPRDRMPDNNIEATYTGTILCQGDDYSCPDNATWIISVPGHGARYGRAACDVHLAFMTRVVMEYHVSHTVDVSPINTPK